MACSPGTALGPQPGREVKGISSESGGIRHLVESMRRANEQLETHSLSAIGPMEAVGAKPMDRGQIRAGEGRK